MATRSTYHIYDGTEHIASAYHHHDGYPTGHIHNVLNAIAVLDAKTGAEIVEAMKALNDAEICRFDFDWKPEWKDEQFNFTFDAAMCTVRMEGDENCPAGSYAAFMSCYAPDEWVVQNWEVFAKKYVPRNRVWEAHDSGK